MDTLSLSTYLSDEGFPLSYCETFEGECLMLHNYILYSLDQSPRLLFISSPEFMRGLLMPVTAREAMFREMIDWHH